MKIIEPKYNSVRVMIYIGTVKLLIKQVEVVVPRALLLHFMQPVAGL